MRLLYLWSFLASTAPAATIRSPVFTVNSAIPDNSDLGLADYTSRIGQEGAEQGASGSTEGGGWTCLRLRKGPDRHDFVFRGKRGEVAAGADWVTLEELKSKEFRSKLDLIQRKGYQDVSITSNPVILNVTDWQRPSAESNFLAADMQ